MLHYGKCRTLIPENSLDTQRYGIAISLQNYWSVLLNQLHLQLCCLCFLRFTCLFYALIYYFP